MISQEPQCFLDTIKTEKNIDSTDLGVLDFDSNFKFSNSLDSGVYPMLITDAYLYEAQSGSIQFMLKANIYDQNASINNLTSQISEHSQRFTITNKEKETVTKNGTFLTGFVSLLSIYSLLVRKIVSIEELQKNTELTADTLNNSQIFRLSKLIGKKFKGLLIRQVQDRYNNPSSFVFTAELTNWYDIESNKSSFEKATNKEATALENAIKRYPANYIKDIRRESAKLDLNEPQPTNFGNTNTYTPPSTQNVDNFLFAGTSTQQTTPQVPQQNKDDDIPF